MALTFSPGLSDGISGSLYLYRPCPCSSRGDHIAGLFIFDDSSAGKAEKAIVYTIISIERWASDQPSKTAPQPGSGNDMIY